MDHPRDDLAADRLVFFSDAVVAIAITLLVLPLVDVVPEAEASHEPVGAILADNRGPIVAFLLSFVVISRLWTIHHGLFDGVERVSQLVVTVDLVWLLTIVVLPFPTALTGSTSDDPLTAQLYVGVLAVNLVTMTVLALLVRRGSEEPDAPARIARGVGLSAALVVAGFLLLLVVPDLGFAVLLLMLIDPVVSGIVRDVRPSRADPPAA